MQLQIPLVLNQALEFGGAYYYVRIFSRVAVVLLSLGTVVSIVIECECPCDVAGDL